MLLYIYTTTLLSAYNTNNQVVHARNYAPSWPTHHLRSDDVDTGEDVVVLRADDLVT